LKLLLLRLARLFPEPFRTEFGEEVRDQIEADYERARARARGDIGKRWPAVLDWCP
jgi:hypothetical protein